MTRLVVSAALAGAIAGCAPEAKTEAPRLTPVEAKARQDKGEALLLVDVRPQEAFAERHIAGAVNAPWKSLPAGHAMLPKDKLLLLYCT